MNENFRYTTLVFPQKVVNNVLHLNIVLLPRNRDPFLPTTTGVATFPETIPFAELAPQFEAKIVRGLEEFPVDNGNPNLPIPFALTVDTATNKEALLRAVETSFGGKINNTASDKAQAPIQEELTVKKYLPVSYRKAFNFTTPRHKNAVTDDSYHCAIRDAVPNANPKTIDLLSWGKVFGYLMKQPMLAKACGFVYSTTLPLEADWFDKGGYLYIDIANADHVQVQDASWTIAEDGSFVKRLAARIPKLKVGEDRTLFAPVLFPVLHSFGGVVTEPLAPWDSIFKEINAYDDGFAKIVHSNQPVSLNLLAEQFDNAHPVHDAGIRLGWDDEQLLIWYVRQMTKNPSDANPKSRIDAPLGLFGYRIDVRRQSDAPWESLNTVVTNQEYMIGNVSVGNPVNTEIELPYQVYPSQVDGQAAKNFWLPMYFTNWIGKSLVMKDDVAAKLYNHDKADRSADVNQLFTEKAISFNLVYGNTYFFRVRLCDMSNGGPEVGDAPSPLIQAPNPAEKVEFKRYIQPARLRFTNLANLLGTDENPDANHVDFYNQTIVAGNEVFDANPVVNIRRPLLGYPAVLFTDKYDRNDALARLQAVADAEADPNSDSPRSGIGIADPDVVQAEIIIEVETLRMDNLMSYSGQENYAHLYTTYRNFNAADFEAALEIPFTFIDAPNLNLSDFLHTITDPFNDPTLLMDNLDGRPDIVVPTARKIRITMRAVCAEDDIYFGGINGPKEKQTRFGSTTQIFLYKESAVEDLLLQPWQTVPIVQGIYLQPDAPVVKLGGVGDLLGRFGASDKPNIVQRLAKQIGIESKGLTLVSNKGQRVVFGCSNRIRHSLAPDQSSITFASKEDLADHWLGCIVYKLNRDWSWDAMEDIAFSFERTKKFKTDTENPAEHLLYLGDIELKPMASFEALQADRFGNNSRNETILIFIDAIEPKTAFTKADGELRFPDELEVEYTIKAKFKAGHGNDPALPQPQKLNLPTTLNPTQVVKLSSVGLAFSPYLINGNYASTEVRQKYLWVEIEEPVKDPNDTLFCRMLAYSPDQLLSNNAFELFEAPEEPPLPIDPEYIRVITPNQTDDLAGLSAMQVMTKATDSDRHYLMPIPPGMHSESAELFGFFTYEFRVGHGHWSDRNNLWSTARGRYGRALRVTGIQHPVPNLLCVVNRDEERLWVNAPYATAVANGKNVTSNPPRTQMWCLLYAQVHQADGKAFRNILLDDRYMDWKRQRFLNDQEAKLAVNTYKSFINNDREFTIDKIKLHQSNQVIDNVLADAQINAGARLAIFKDQPRMGMASWTNKEVLALLQRYGLPEDSALSILGVEVFGNITNIREHLTKLYEQTQQRSTYKMMSGNVDAHTAEELRRNIEHAGSKQTEEFLNNVQLRPLSSGLGHYRILRSSPLTEVPFVCCTE